MFAMELWKRRKVSRLVKVPPAISLKYPLAQHADTSLFEIHKTRSSADTTTETDRINSQLSEDQRATLEAFAPDDTSIIAVPPKALALTKESVSRRDSAPLSLLEKYRHRSNSSRSSLEPEGVSPTSGPATGQRQPASLPSDFQILQHIASAEGSMEIGMATRSSDESENFTTMSQVSPSRADVRDAATARKTRSQSRRQDRVDSHDSSAMISQIPTLSSKRAEDVDGHRDGDDDKSTELAEVLSDIPRSLCIRNKEASRTPSPRSQRDGEALQPPLRSPARKIAAFLRSPSPDERSPNASPKPLKLLIPAGSKTYPAEDVPPRGATMKERLAFARARAPSPPLDAEALMVAVRPPMFDVSKGVCQWISDLPSTSRPDRVWEWPKRWTCCRCDATTIVEQRICSSLECSHYRCPNDCRIIRVARPLGQWAGGGGH